MEPRFVDYPSFTAVGLATPFDFVTAQQTIPTLWDRFVPRMKEVRNVPDRRSFGICRGHEYLACVQVTQVEAVPAGMVAWTVPAGHYAVFTHRGPVSRIGETVNRIWKDWLPSSGRVHVEGAPDFELYDERFQGASEESEFDLYIPIRK